VSRKPDILAFNIAVDGDNDMRAAWFLDHEEEIREWLRAGPEPAGDARRGEPALEDADVQLLAWAVVNCHTLARRALARSLSVYDREKWEHVLRICEKAGARAQGVLRASVPTEMTEG